jgi:peptide chain release factor 1
MLIEKIRKYLARHKEIEELLATPEVTADPRKMEVFGREYTHIGKMLPVLKKYSDAHDSLADAKAILKNESDSDLIELAQQEVQTLEHMLPELEEQAKTLLVPKNPVDFKNALMEIRAGTGGVEAGIFAADLYRMYSVYIENRGWNTEIMTMNPGEKGALKEVIFLIKGENAYGTLKYESGVHRVQRVPDTEAQGRIHTSAASVVVFPEADDVELLINPEDLRIDVYRSQGAGGQHVNKTESAVRIVHIPTGLMVTCQDEKSQHKNKSRAMKVLKSRLLEKKRAEVDAAESASRKSIIGTGDRSEKIRTYNFPQNRVTDHRINLTLYQLDKIINGNIQELIDELAIADINEKVMSDHIV